MRMFSKHRRRWEDNTKMDVEVQIGRMDWIYLAKYRESWRPFKAGNEPQGSTK